MDVKLYDKRPLTVGAFRFDADAAMASYGAAFDADLRGMQVGPAVLRYDWRSRCWSVWNPGRSAAGDWQEIHHGDYVIIAPTGCRYPVQADQFERNYAEVVEGDALREFA